MIGEIVTCIDDSGHIASNEYQDISSSLVKGRDYIIYKEYICEICQELIYDVGIKYPTLDSYTCCKCEMIIDYGSGIWWCNSKRFAKKEKKVEICYVKLEVEVEEPCLN